MCDSVGDTSSGLPAQAQPPRTHDRESTRSDCLGARAIVNTVLCDYHRRLAVIVAVQTLQTQPLLIMMVRCCGASVASAALVVLVLLAAAIPAVTARRPPINVAAVNPLTDGKANNVTCSCRNQSLCTPLATPLPTSGEFLAFSIDPSNWKSYDWSKVTTLVDVTNTYMDDRLCHAHAHNARVTYYTSMPAAQLTNATYVDAFVSAAVARVVAWGYDGVNIDFEWPIAANDTARRDGLTAMMLRLAEALRPVLPNGGQLTFDVAWAAEGPAGGIDGRNFDYAALMIICDFVVIMDYDTRSQVFSEACNAGPNAPARTVLDGVASFLALYNQPEKLALGVPWYGYDYPCLAGTAPNTTVCPIARVPFRGCNCSDAAGHQYDFSVMTQMANASVPQRVARVTRPLAVNTTAAGDGLWAGFNYVHAATGAVHQVWFDSAADLAVKYGVARRMGLRGASCWHVDALYYGADGAQERQTAGMWAALDGLRG